MKTYEFTLNLRGVWDDLTNEMVDRLFEAGCDDGLVGVSGRRVSVAFDREADSAKDAVFSAVANVRAAGFEVDRIAEADLASQAEIAERLGKSKQYVHMLVNGERGPGTFPSPLTPSRWSWSEVADWLADNGLADGALAECARVVAVVNATLAYREVREESPDLVAAVEAGV